METQAQSSGRLRKIVVVFKTHFDLGFTGLPAEVMSQYTGSMFEAVQRTMQTTAVEPGHLRYNWTLPAWPLKFLLHDPSVPVETRLAARKLVESGQLMWHAWPFTTHTAFCGLEELVRGLHISRGLSEEFGRWPTGAKQTDVPGHTWALPSLLARAGVKFLHIGCNSGSHAPHVPRLFWWEGPDGARLLTYYSSGGYGTPLLPPDDWPFDTWLALQQTVDNHGPHLPADLAEIRRLAEEGAPGVDLVFGELGDFAESLLERPEQLAGLPVVPYDLADTWIHGIGTMPREVARVRELRAKLLALEVAAAEHDWPGIEGAGHDFPLARRVAPLIDAAYEQLLLFGEHTWGLDVKSTIQRVYGPEFAAARHSESYRRLESSWVAKGAYVEKAEQLYAEAEQLVQEAVAAEPRVFPTYGNDLDYERRDLPEAGPTLDDVTPDNVLETSLLRLKVDPASGGIASLVDKRTGREWVDSASLEPFGGYRYDLYSIADIAEFMRAYGLFFQDWFVQDFGKQGYPEDSRHITAYARDFKLERVRGESGDYILLSGGQLRAQQPTNEALPAQTVSITIKLKFGSDASTPFLDLEYYVQGKEATPLAESTAVPFPMNLPKPTFRLGQTGSIIDPGRDIIEGANRELWCADWVYATDDRVGLCILPIDMPLVSIGNTGIFRFEPARVPTEPLIYAHLSNTQWGTNFPQWLEGDFRWRVPVLLPLRGGSMGVIVTGRHMQKLHAYRAPEQVGPFVTTGKLLSARPRHDGSGLILRVWEEDGYHYSQASLHLQGPVLAVWRCDLMERPIEKLIIEVPHHFEHDTRVDLKMPPHAVETLLVEFDAPVGESL